MNADVALMKAWNLGMSDAGWTAEAMDDAEPLLPALRAAGYAEVDDDAWTWWFTAKGVARAEELETGGSKFDSPLP